MDVLNTLFVKADQEKLLQPLANKVIGHRLSMYADDVVLFIHSSAGDLSTTKAILHCFGMVSGLITNMHKNSILPIKCQDSGLDMVRSEMLCSISTFPCKYLSLPLTFSKLRKEDLQPLIDKLDDHLPGWKAAMLNIAGRSVLVCAVLTTIPIYTLMALEVPKWVIKTIDKRWRVFLWKGRQ